jgi:hypothetical protein
MAVHLHKDKPLNKKFENGSNVPQYVAKNTTKEFKLPAATYITTYETEKCQK